MIWSRIDIPTVRALAVSLLVQLERCVRADVLYVLISLRLVAARLGATATHSLGGWIAADGEVLVPMCLRLDTAS